MYTGPHIVTDQLVLAMDAASKRSYPGTGTTWFDLSENGYNSNMGAGEDEGHMEQQRLYVICW